MLEKNKKEPESYPESESEKNSSKFKSVVPPNDDEKDYNI